MPSKEIDLGPTGQRVAANVVALRERRRITKAELGRRLKALGRPMSLDVLTKLEKGTRRVDSDDLVALALVLDVSPLRLLLPDSAEEDQYEPLTDAFDVSRKSAWKWGRGEYSLFAGTDYVIQPKDRGAEHGAEVYRRRTEFPRENRPDLEVPQMERVGPHWGALQQLWLDAQAVADEIGCSVESVLGLVPSAKVHEVGGVGRSAGKEDTSDGER